MLNKHKQLNLFGLAMRAGLLVTGEDAVVQEVKKGKVVLVVMAEDCGENTQKKVTDKCHYYNVDVIKQFNAQEMSQAIGKSRKVVAFCDEGFANSFMKLQH